jgi:cytochrome c556
VESKRRITDPSSLIPDASSGTSFAAKGRQPVYLQEESMPRSNLTKPLALTAITAIILGIVWHSPAAARKAAPKPAKSKPDKSREKKPLLSKFMREKLTASSQVLEGLCTEDFDLISKGAKRLKTVSSAEKWRVSNDAMYRQHSAEFRSGVDKLLKAAQAKKIDSAALAWTKTTLNCIECHRWVKAMLISGDRPSRRKTPKAAK